MPRTGVVLRPQLPPADLLGFARRADAAGLDELWLWEDCFFESGVATAAAVLAATERVHVGIGLLPVPLRNPALAAMELATIAGMFPGRFLPGLGHGIQGWMGQVGARSASPLGLLRDHLTVVRELLAGAPVTRHTEHVHLDDVRLTWPPAVIPPLLVGARGPRTLRLAGALADGIILDSGVSLADVRAGVAEEAAGRADAGRGGTGAVVVYRELADARGAADAIAETTTAGATSVVLQPPEDAPDPSALIEAVAAARS